MTKSTWQKEGKNTFDKEKVIALAGNPNVGKSTVFNALTGMKQHTGNWTGKTVSTAEGMFTTEKYRYKLVDVPGTYSLMSRSAEEELARNFICFGKPDMVIVVCDATCLERNLPLALQIMEVSQNVIVCVNLMDEAEHKGIEIDIKRLSRKLNVPVVGITARDKKTIAPLIQEIDRNINRGSGTAEIEYPLQIEQAAGQLERLAENRPYDINPRWLSVKLLEKDDSLLNEMKKQLGENFEKDAELWNAAGQVYMQLEAEGITKEKVSDTIAETFIHKSEAICADVVKFKVKDYSLSDRKADNFLTGKYTAFPVMIIFLFIILWLTITAANYPSQWLSQILFYLQDKLTELFDYLNTPQWLHGILVLGVYRVTAWVISVMLPPMLIFFPLFTFMEDIGYLPRIAYNLDKPFKKCGACGKQALTMCMGFGCNAVGVTGCRIIDSPRERLLAVLTNGFVPCNGRFPTLIAVITMFMIGTAKGGAQSVAGAAVLAVVILVGIYATFIITGLLSKTLLKGEISSFVLELPPYRKPQVGKIIVRSVLDRSLFVLGRAMSVAAPAGAVIWIMANTAISGETMLNICADFLNPFARIIGLDGVILLAFILGFPANEIVIPLVIMGYTAQGTLTEAAGFVQLKQLFLNNGWNMTTALCTMVFCLMHWPCSTTLLTVKKETGSLKWAVLAALIPTAAGVLCCMAINFISILII